MTQWPLFGEPEPPDEDLPHCPHCGAPVPGYASYCEGCGGPLVPTQPPPAPDAPADAPSAQTRRLGERVSQVTVCASCGGTIDADGYCQTCGSKAPDPHDHEEAAPADWVAGVCDRGLSHPRNEDAMALWADGSRAVLVVCDGVTTSTDADIAAQAAAKAACEFLAASFEEHLDPDDLMRAAVAHANDAVIAATPPDSANTASATFAAAVVDGDRLVFASLGDSRVYWSGESQAMLTTDDSMAQEFIAHGMSRRAAEAMPQAHAITKWLGRDATDLVPDSGTRALEGPGWVVVCTDGLWNYASDADTLASAMGDVAGPDDTPLSLARGLVAWANDQGGHDNVTVALAKVPQRDNLESEQADGKAEHGDLHFCRLPE